MAKSARQAFALCPVPPVPPVPYRLLAACSAALLVAAGSAFALEGSFRSLPAAGWWAVQAMSGCAYGDTVPAAALPRVLAALLGLLGFGAIAAAVADAVPARPLADADLSRQRAGPALARLAAAGVPAAVVRGLEARHERWCRAVQARARG